MLVSLQGSLLRRPYADLSDLTSKAITSRGWQETNGQDFYVIDFAVALTAAEEAAVRRRLTTRNATEETLFGMGVTALDTDRNFRDVITPQLLSGANAIINDPGITQAEAITYVVNLATAVRSLTNQVESLTRQNIALIRLAQDILDGTD